MRWLGRQRSLLTSADYDVIDGGTRSLTCKAEKQTKVAILSREVFDEITSSHPEVLLDYVSQVIPEAASTPFAHPPGDRASVACCRLLHPRDAGPDA